MSNRVSIRSLGVSGAYLSTPDAGPDGVSMVPSLVPTGFGGMSVEFALHRALPTELSSQNEEHWIFSFHDRYLHTDILAIGITPIGAVVVACPGGNYEMFGPGTVYADGKKHAARLDWSWLSATVYLTFDGVRRSQVTGSVDPAVPISLGVFSVLNGGNARSLFHVSVSAASATYGYLESPDNEKQYATWAFSEGSGDTAACVVSGATPVPNGIEIFDLTLTRKWMNDYPCPWPTDFSGDPGEGAAWELKTPYTRRTRATTRYRKRRVSWLS